MRRKFIAGNWKMNLNRTESVALARELVERVGISSPVELAVCPPFVYLESVGQVLRGSAIGLGAQNMYFQSNGAFTGEVSDTMLLDLGCRYVILGHSERRHVIGESNADVNRKVQAALQAGLIPIVCLGETLAEREAGKTQVVVTEQFDGSLSRVSLSDMVRVVIAYEPVWAIGTGKVATPNQAEEVHAELRRLIRSRYNANVADLVRIQYGGSVKPDNAAELLRQPNIDGALVGGASLKANDLIGIVAGACA